MVTTVMATSNHAIRIFEGMRKYSEQAKGPASGASCDRLSETREIPRR
jgi:hypothetical protein